MLSNIISLVNKTDILSEVNEDKDFTVSCTTEVIKISLGTVLFNIAFNWKKFMKLGSL